MIFQFFTKHVPQNCYLFFQILSPNFTCSATMILLTNTLEFWKTERCAVMRVNGSILKQLDT